MFLDLYPTFASGRKFDAMGMSVEWNRRVLDACKGQPLQHFSADVEPSIFLNEAYLLISLKVTSECLWLQESCLQVVPQNVKMSALASDDRTPELHFGPFQRPEEWDGPVFKLDQISSPKFELVNRCHLSGLQTVDEPVLKFRLFLLFQECPIPCKGVVNFPVPLCQNMPHLNLNT